MSYSKSFKNIKTNLLKLYLNARAVKNLIRGAKSIKISLVHDETSISPAVVIEHDNFKTEITGFFNYGEKTDHTLHVGYKNADDWLALDGKLLSKSAKFKRQIELTICDNSYVQWFFYKIREFVIAKLSK